MVLYVPILAPVVQIVREYQIRSSITKIEDHSLENRLFKMKQIKQLMNLEYDSREGGVIQVISCIFLSVVTSFSIFVLVPIGFTCAQLMVNSYLIEKSHQSLKQYGCRVLNIFRQHLKQELQGVSQKIQEHETILSEQQFLQLSLAERTTVVNSFIKPLSENFLPGILSCKKVFEEVFILDEPISSELVKLRELELAIYLMQGRLARMKIPTEVPKWEECCQKALKGFKESIFDNKTEKGLLRAIIE